MCTENLSASKIVSIKDLRETLQHKTPDATAKQDYTESTQRLSGRETGREPAAAAGPRDVSRNSVQMPGGSVAKPTSKTRGGVFVTRAAATESSSRPPGTLASLLQGSQADEAKAYFTGLLPGNVPPPRPAGGHKLPAGKAGAAVPSFTGFTGKLGSATNAIAGTVPRFDFTAVSVFGVTHVLC